MGKCVYYILCVLAVIFLASCSTTKFVPQDKLLLNKMHVKIDDRKDIREQHREHEEIVTADALATKMRGYVRQKPNSEVLGFWKLQLQLYSLASPDSTKWINRVLWKMGEAPEVFDPNLAQSSLYNIRQGMRNKGYFNAVVDTTMSVKNRRLALTYHITAGQPYILSNYRVSLMQEDLRRFATSKRTLVTEGMVFDSEVLDEERERIARAMRRNGYFYFDKSLLRYRADSSFSVSGLASSHSDNGLTSHNVSAELLMQDYIENAPDSVKTKLFTRYSIRKVHFYVDSDPEKPDDEQTYIIEDGNYVFHYKGRKLLRENVLKKNCSIRPGEFYNIFRVERSYSDLNSLGPVKYVDISFDQVGTDELDCNVVISRGKLNAVSAEIEGTYSAGDWGIAAGLGYTNRNIFRGAEQLNINGRGSYEWRQNGGRAIEAQAEASLTFPKAPKVSIGYRFQNRPEEFTRTIANASLSYKYRQFGSKLTHQFNFVDINYVYLPWISDEFRAAFLKPSNLLRYSYQDHFIVDWSYGGTWTSFSERTPYRSYFNINYQIETAGNFLYGLSRVFSLPRDDSDGAYKIFNIRYSQYAKADFSIAYHQIFSPAHRLVYHAAFGLAVPYLNASSVPFEKRYFAGGSNSVRGWQIRSLGPGKYRGQGTLIDYNNQAGDIKLDLNLEYRWKVWSIIELAAFTDAGNIWTIRDYDSQPGGVFDVREFYKQIAWAYGVGLRLDFSFFVFRVDFGVKLYDPSRIDEGKAWRTVPNGLGWKDDMTFHFAIGHPF